MTPRVAPGFWPGVGFALSALGFITSSAAASAGQLLALPFVAVGLVGAAVNWHMGREVGPSKEQYETAWVRENAANCELTEEVAKLRAEREAVLNLAALWDSLPGKESFAPAFAEELRAALAEKGE